MVVYNGRVVCLFIFCSTCRKWRMPLEGGHTGSHHQQFLNGQPCLPIGHSAWLMRFRINQYFGIDDPVEPVSWVPAHNHPNIHGPVNHQPPRMIEYRQEAAADNAPVDMGSVNDNDEVDPLPPPPAAVQLNHRQDNENNIAGHAPRRSGRDGAGRIDRYSPPPKRQRRNPLRNREANRNRAQDDSSDEGIDDDSDFDDES